MVLRQLLQSRAYLMYFSEGFPPGMTSLESTRFFQVLEFFAMALRKWRPRKRSCQVLYTLAKEPTIKVWVKSLPQLLFTVAFARECSATASSIRADAEACPGFQPESETNTRTLLSLELHEEFARAYGVFS